MAILDRLFLAGGYAAAFFLALIGVLILLQIAGRLLGFVVPAGDDFAAWSLAASIFLSLAHALKGGHHIRVTLIIQRLPKGLRHVVELWCLGLATLVSAYFALYAILFVHESFVFGETAAGAVALPLWIPQSSMAIGLVLLALAFASELVRVVRGGEIRDESEASRTE